MNYFRMDGVDGDYFKCEPYKATIAVASCIKMWTGARAVAIEDCKNILCLECAVGPVHAGHCQQKIKVPETLCARCGRTGHRLIRGSVCVSCYNREREYLLGCNAKGSFPTQARPVGPMELLVADGGRIRFDRVADAIEAVVSTFRTRPGVAVRPVFQMGRIITRAPQRSAGRFNFWVPQGAGVPRAVCRAVQIMLFSVADCPRRRRSFSPLPRAVFCDSQMGLFA